MPLVRSVTVYTHSAELFWATSAKISSTESDTTRRGPLNRFKSSCSKFWTNSKVEASAVRRCHVGRIVQSGVLYSLDFYSGLGEEAKRKESGNADPRHVHRGNPANLFVLYDVGTHGHHDAAEPAARARLRPAVMGVVGVFSFLGVGGGVGPECCSFAAPAAPRHEGDRDDENSVFFVRTAKRATHRNILGCSVQ